MAFGVQRHISDSNSHPASECTWSSVLSNCFKSCRYAGAACPPPIGPLFSVFHVRRLISVEAAISIVPCLLNLLFIVANTSSSLFIIGDDMVKNNVPAEAKIGFTVTLVLMLSAVGAVLYVSVFR
jgi:hypothetical protein